MADAPKRIFLGALDVSQDEALAIALPVNGSIEDVRRAIEAARRARLLSPSSPGRGVTFISLAA